MSRLALSLVAALLVAAPAFAQYAPGLSPAERQQGAQAHAQIVQQFGGAMSGPAADYVRSVGQKIAAQSGGGARPQDYTVTLLNSNVNNAFALPGGYVYITRQLLALMNDEAELAFVMGHEVGHVAARHGQKRQTAQTLGNIAAAGVGLGTKSDFWARVMGVTAQMATLRFSRGQERQADSLGVRYLTSAGYDPLASGDILAALGAQSDLEARLQGRTPQGGGLSEFFSTHPNNPERVARIRAEAQGFVAQAGARAHNRDAFLAAIEGLPYDVEGGQAVVQGGSVRNVTLQLALDAPAGFTVNQANDAITGTGPNGTSFDLRPTDGRAELGAIAAARWQQLGLQPRPMQATRINGQEALEGMAQAQTAGGPVEARLTVYRWTSQLAFTLISVAPQGQGAIVAPVAASVRRLLPQDGAAVRSRRIEVVRVGATDSLASLAARMAYDDGKMERFLTLNQLPRGAALKAGDRVKLVVWR